jgi:plastocyanin
MLNGKTTIHRVAPWILGALAMTAAMACGGSSSDKSAGDDGAKAPAAAATKPSQPTAAAAPTTAAPAASGPLKLVATNILFDKKELSAAAGTVTLDLDNQDAGVPHNVHVFSGADATGASLGATALEAGPIKQSLKLDLAKGQYFFVCDVHPTTMTGTITVG